MHAPTSIAGEGATGARDRANDEVARDAAARSTTRLGISSGGDRGDDGGYATFATIDSLALKRARLPLRLVPVRDAATGEIGDSDESSRRSTLKAMTGLRSRSAGTGIGTEGAVATSIVDGFVLVEKVLGRFPDAEGLEEVGVRRTTTTELDRSRAGKSCLRNETAGRAIVKGWRRIRRRKPRRRRSTTTTRTMKGGGRRSAENAGSRTMSRGARSEDRGRNRGGYVRCISVLDRARPSDREERRASVAEAVYEAVSESARAAADEETTEEPGESVSDAYDDVGPCPDERVRRPTDDEDDDYDDVGLPFVAARRSSVDTLFEEMSLEGDDYDDVGTSPLAATRSNRCRNEYSSVDERSEEDPTYDDVLAPGEDRVNSLYGGSSSGSRLGSLLRGKDSEWEDCDELPPGSSPIGKDASRTLTRGGKSRILGRRRSRTSRGNRLPSRAALRGNRASSASVTVCLGTGSILLVGGGLESRVGERSERPGDSGPHRRTEGLVQLRIVAKRVEDSIDTQETSCYILEDTASDDSNYETVLSSFSSERCGNGNGGGGGSSASSNVVVVSGSEAEKEEEAEGREDGETATLSVERRQPEAPSRPVPPPPRESSLTESFGRRMRMLRRTWSITKGSLGRMRRKPWTSEADNAGEGADDRDKGQRSRHAGSEARKYFSFKKHFGKSATGLSTFYLESKTRDSSNDDDRAQVSRHHRDDADDPDDSNWYSNAEYWKRGDGNEAEYRSALEEEPLYQFYAAAATRIALESDSEGYEEVRDPTPSPSTVDLAKPGHRTLWCQTDRVLESDLLQRLTPEEKKCQEAKFEILTSEASYLNSLRVLVRQFVSDERLRREVLTPCESDRLFGGVPDVLAASERLLARLEAVWREDPMLRGLPEILLGHAGASAAAYVAYCSNQVRIDATLGELRSRKASKFAETVARIESDPACQSLTLHSFLMLPMQRVTRLPLLADAVLSKLSSEDREERERWERALSRLARVVDECNEGARAAGRLAETEALERKLEYAAKVAPIDLGDRYVVRRGPVVHLLARSEADYRLTFGRKYHKASLYLFLLTDRLLIAKPKSSGGNEETYTVIDACKRSLAELESVGEDSPFAGRNAMLLTLLENHAGRQVEYVLACENATERERWLDAVSPPRPSLVGESLYETWDCPQVMTLYPYAASQPDELSVQPGEVINVLRKMSDGWYLGEKLLGGEQGWFPGNYAKEVASEHVRARNLRQRHRLLALSSSVLQQRAKRAPR